MGWSGDLFALSFLYLLFFISSLVRIWSYYYMDNDSAFQRFNLIIMAFILAMVILIISSNLCTALIGWDGLGVTSFLLVVYYKKRNSLGSGMMTALTNRLGDCFLLCRLGLFLRGPAVNILVLLILIRITKRAQIPFSSWLPAAMAAPTPVRALVHSSTLVTAGVYVLIRYCKFDMSQLIYIGSGTMILAGLRACVERDLKKIVALSTLSQLGVIMVSIGTNSKSYCFFHLISHACFKALLFLCVGTFIHSVYGSQDHRSFDKMNPIPLSVFCAIANLSLLGFFFTSGFYRKDMILEELYRGASSLLIAIFLIGIGLTSCYSMKILTITIFKSAFTVSATIALGGMSWQAKIPIYLLGTFSVCFGSKIEVWTNLYQGGALHIYDKTITLLIIGIGWILGNRYNNPRFSRLIHLTPTTQRAAFTPNLTGTTQKCLDKGWLMAVSYIPSAVLHSTSVVTRIGLSAILLNLLYD